MTPSAELSPVEWACLQEISEVVDDRVHPSALACNFPTL